MNNWNCKNCGHDWEDHVYYELEEGCRCGSCMTDAEYIECQYGKDLEDNEGPPCDCKKWEE